MTLPRLTRDLRQLALGLCLGFPLLVLLNLIGLTVLLHTFDEPRTDEHEPTGSFVCISGEAGTLPLCVQSCNALPMNSATRWISGSTTR